MTGMQKKIRGLVLAAAIFVTAFTACEYNGFVPVDSPPADLMMFALYFEGHTPIIGIPIDPVYRLPDGVTYNNADRIASCTSAEDGPIDAEFLSYITDDRYPKLSGIEMPEELEIGSRFEVKLTAESGLDRAKNVLVFVTDSSRYYEVPIEKVDGNTVTINAKLLIDQRLVSTPNYYIKFALIDEDGHYGNCYEGGLRVLSINKSPVVKLDDDVKDVTPGEEIHLMSLVHHFYDPDADEFDCVWEVDKYQVLGVNGDGEDEYQDADIEDFDGLTQDGSFDEATITLQDGDKVTLKLTCTDEGGESDYDKIKLSNEE